MSESTKNNKIGLDKESPSPCKINDADPSKVMTLKERSLVLFTNKALFDECVNSSIPYNVRVAQRFQEAMERGRLEAEALQKEKRQRIKDEREQAALKKQRDKYERRCIKRGLTYGIGISDMPAKVRGVVLDSHKAWTALLQMHCADTSIALCEDWLRYSTFAAWYDANAIPSIGYFGKNKVSQWALAYGLTEYNPSTVRIG